ncbi:MAG: hypothetical protein ACLPQS_09200 [Acidimicrobiales bacterium]
MKLNLKSVAGQTPALVIATAALCLSLGTGVGVAATVLSGRAIAPHSIPGNRIVDHSITSQQLAGHGISVQKLHLEHGWTSEEGKYGTGNPELVTNGTGIAYLAGSLHGGKSDVAFVLPAGYRPSHELYINIYTLDGRSGILFIPPSGKVEIYDGGATSFASLAGVSFPIGQ